MDMGLIKELGGLNMEVSNIKARQDRTDHVIERVESKIDKLQFWMMVFFAGMVVQMGVLLYSVK